ncbi:Arsenic resistance transcriptional regulator ArsR1 [Candidatus Magnetaquicoccaceae bacterium FCR-1]|uniref:Arsenic resistance transcriptional regulator ArsR1 n=1 Tax=Candidatus Magnetaquiglobus chichijimensis TaxID=3141448 RepID=A0ABQ0C810_9PROT
MITPERLLKCLVDETRLRCVHLLLRENELCVCEFGHALSEVQPKISRHLATLREHHLVLDRRAGQWVYYRLHPELPAWALALLRALDEGLRGSERHEADHARLCEMPDRPNRCSAPFTI